MATINILRTVGGIRATQLIGPHLMRKIAAPSCCLNQRLAAISTTPQRKERIYAPPEPSDLHNDIKHWKNERVWMASMIPIIPIAIAFPNPVMDYLLAGTVMFHTYQGFAGACVDYMHGRVIHVVAKTFVTAISIIAFTGLCYLNYADIGFGETVRKLYRELK